MVGKNALWVAKQHGHSIATMLRAYAAWAEGTAEVDIGAIKRSMNAGEAGWTRHVVSTRSRTTMNVRDIVLSLRPPPPAGTRCGHQYVKARCRRPELLASMCLRTRRHSPQSRA